MPYEAERNWANECREIRGQYGILKDDDEIAEISKEIWKKEVKNLVIKKYLGESNEEKRKMKKISHVDCYDSLRSQDYIRSMQSSVLVF